MSAAYSSRGSQWGSEISNSQLNSHSGGKENTHQSPGGERRRLTTATADGEGVDEDHDLSTTVERRAEQEVVLAEPASPVPGAEQSIRILD